MISVSNWTSAIFAAFFFLAGVAFALVAKPIIKSGLMAYWQSEYADLTFKCDQSMRVHFMAKQRVAIESSEQNVDALKAAEIGLIDCQAYDLLQKKMKRWGLTDNEVSEMALKAIEADGGDIRSVVQIHEITN